MINTNGFTVNPGWRVLMGDLGINVTNILRRAGLPDDLFNRENAILSTDEYFRMWKGIEEESNDPLIPLNMGKIISVESFDPPIFAAFCSPDLNTALERIGRYKKLVCPMTLDLERKSDSTTMIVKWLDSTIEAPTSLYAGELVFFVQLARMATRETISPMKIITPKLPDKLDNYVAFFGTPLVKGDKLSITFSARDASRPFLTVNQHMWKFFEPELQKRLSELDNNATIADRVRGALFELLPSGDSSIESVSKKLGTSKRTLQRRLSSCGETYQAVLNRTRTDLACHYLENPELSGTEISFLLGFEDPNSFFRAFHSWTGKTAEQVRRSVENSQMA